MKRWSAQHLLTVIAISALAWAAIAGAALLVGSTTNGPPDGARFWPSNMQVTERMQHVLVASLVGAALAAAGVVYQAVLRNPLSDPYLLGVSSGAALASYIWGIVSVGLLVHLGMNGAAPLSQQAFAFVGAAICVAIVFITSTRRGRLEPITLLLVGVIANVVNGAAFLLLSELRADQTAQMRFLVGAIRAVESSQMLSAAAVIGAGWLVLLSFSGQLNVALLSEAEAMSLGVRIHRLRWIALVVASLMTASAVAISGPIGFIGLICPHLMRRLVGNDQRRLLPVATAAGAGLLTLADALSRLLSQQRFIGTELPVGILTAIVGGPFFIALLYQSRHRAGHKEGAA